MFNKKPDPLSAGTNWVITNAPDLYLYGTLAQSAPYLKNDERVATWAALYSNALRAEEVANCRNRTTQGPLQMRSDTVPLQ